VPLELERGERLMMYFRGRIYRLSWWIGYGEWEKGRQQVSNSTHDPGQEGASPLFPVL
jgi:hypothetical protein